MNVSSLLLPFVFASAAVAQSASISLQTAAVAQVTVNGQAQTATLPAGPVGLSGGLSQSSGGSFINATWDTYVEPTGVYFDIAAHAYVDAVAGTSAQTSGMDFIYELSNPTPVAIELRLRRMGVMAGASLLVDVSNDGSAELTNSSASGDVVLALTIGPVPLPIRVLYNVSQAGLGGHDSYLTIVAQPTAGIYSTQLVQGCDISHHQDMQPRFDGGIWLRVVGPLQNTKPSVMVLGTSLQPIVLPAAASFPCLLVPSPDLLLFPGSQAVNLQIPAAARPYRFYVQGVVLRPNVLHTTNAIQVSGY
ncbi:MAG: hypothetical protein ACI8UD_001860 [Planctomycetota bacterium]|jgi:hypothetical protein